MCIYIWRWSNEISKLWRNKREPPTGNLLPPNKAFNTRIGFHLIELLTLEVPWESPNNLGFCQDNRSPSTNWQQGPNCWRQQPHNSLNKERSSRRLHTPFTLHSSIFGIGTCSVCYQKRNVNIKPIANPLIYNGILPAKYARAMVSELEWLVNQYLTWFKDRFMRRNWHLTLLQRPGTRQWLAQGPRIKSNTTSLFFFLEKR